MLKSKRAKIEKGQIWQRTTSAFLYRIVKIVRGRIHLKISDYPSHTEHVETPKSLRENYTFIWGIVLFAWLAMLGQVAQAQTTVLYYDFSRGTATSNVSTMPTNGTTVGGALAPISALSTKAMIFSSTTPVRAVPGSATAGEGYYGATIMPALNGDFYGSLTMTANTATSVTGVLGRIQAPAGGAYNAENLDYEADSGQVRLFHFVNGVGSTPVTTSVPYVLNTVIYLRLNVNGTTATAYYTTNTYANLAAAIAGNTWTSAGSETMPGTIGTTAGYGGISGYSNIANVGINEFMATVPGGALAAGSITSNATTSTSIKPQIATVTGGTPPYSVQFQYSTTTNGTYTNIGSPVTGVGSGGSPVAPSAQTGLTAATTYYFRAVVTDSASTSATFPSSTTGTPLATSATNSFTVTPGTIPANRSTSLFVALVGSGTAWVNGTTTMTPSVVAGITVVSTTVTDGTHATVVLSLPSSAGATGTLTLTEGGTGTATGTVIVASPSFSLSSTTGAPSVNASITVTGTNTLWNTTTTFSPTSGLFTVSGGTGASISSIAVVSDTSVTFTLSPGSTGGTLTITDAQSGTTQTFTVTNIVPFSNANIFYSPYNWRTGSTFQGSDYPGAYFKTKFSGTSLSLQVDASALSGFSSTLWPRVMACVDGGAWLPSATNFNVPVTTLTYGTVDGSNNSLITIASGLANTTHTLEVLLIGCDNTQDIWITPANEFRLKGLVLDSGAVLSAPTLKSKRAVIWGDSITANYLPLSPNTGGAGFNFEDSRFGWVRAAAQALDCEYGDMGIGSQGWNVGGASGGSVTYPFYNTGTPANSSWNRYSAATAQSFATVPDYAFVAQGTNDSVSTAVQTAATAFISAFRTACPTTGGKGKLFLIAPYGTTGAGNAAYISAAVTASGDTSTYYLNLNLNEGCWAWEIPRFIVGTAYIQCLYVCQDRGQGCSNDTIRHWRVYDDTHYQGVSPGESPGRQKLMRNLRTSFAALALMLCFTQAWASIIVYRFKGVDDTGALVSGAVVALNTVKSFNASTLGTTIAFTTTSAGTAPYTTTGVAPTWNLTANNVNLQVLDLGNGDYGVPYDPEGAYGEILINLTFSKGGSTITNQNASISLALTKDSSRVLNADSVSPGC